MDEESSVEFDVAQWLAAQGVHEWPVDGSCARQADDAGVTAAPIINECLCRGIITVAGRSLLHCQNPRRPAEDPELPYVTHTVLYAVQPGLMRVLLDLPTSAALGDCWADRSDRCWVELTMRGAPDGLWVADDPEASCDGALQEQDERIRRGETWRLGLRDAFRRVCTSRGRYLLRAGSLIPPNGV